LFCTEWCGTVHLPKTTQDKNASLRLKHLLARTLRDAHEA